MAIRFPRRPHFLPATAGVLAAIALVTPSIAAAAPNAPVAPADVVTIQKQLGTLALQNAMLVEKFDVARIELATAQRAAAKANAAAQAAAANYERARTAISATIAVQYEAGSFSTTGALLSSDNGQGYLARLQALSMLSAHSAQVAKQMGDANAAADATAQRAATLVSDARARSEALGKQQATLGTQIAKYSSLLGMLNSAQRTDYQRAVAPPVSAASVFLAKVQLALTATPAAQKAVHFALAQVGKPYVWAAAGPSSYDCSGLTMAAWATAGVRLPHSSELQFTLGRAVAVNQAQPGDLIFLYGPPPSHVTIYIGSGLMVSAPTEGQDVSVVPLSAFQSDIVGVRRFG